MTPLGVLLAMAEGRRRHEWLMQAALMAHIAQQVGNPDARTQDYDPYADPDAGIEEISMSDLRATLRAAN